MGEKSFKVVLAVARFGMSFWHPIFKVQGRENIPEGGCIICPNHCSASDGPWVVFAIKPRKLMRIMVKQQVMDIPVLKYMFQWFDFIGVQRETGDIAAIKKSLKALKDGDQLLMFPEGTRVKHGNRIPGKTGAAMMATRTGVPVLPVYIETKRHFWSKLHAVIGKPYQMVEPGTRVTSDQLQELTDELMEKIYGLEKDICR